MYEILILVLIFLVFRLIQLSYNKYLVDYFSFDPVGDAATYILLIQFFRNNNCGVLDKRCLIGNDPVLTPSLYLKAVGLFFTDKTLSEKAWLPNFIIFMVGTVIGFLLFKPFFLQFGVVGSRELYLTFLFLSSFLFITQVENINYGSQRIHFWTVQPRFLGVVSNSLAWLGYFAFESGMLQLAFVSLFFFISLNISYFPRQATVLVSIFYFILSGDWYPLFGGFIAVFFSAIMFRGEFMESILPQLNYSFNYFKNTPKAGKTGNFLVRLIKTLFSRSVLELINYLSCVVTLGLTFFVYYDDYVGWSWGADILVFKYLCFLSSVFIIFTITSFRYFSSLGESWRYLASTLYFVPYFSLPILLHYFTEDIFLTVFLSLLLGLAQLAISSTFSKTEFINDNKYLRPLLEKNNAEIESARWFGIPYKISNYAITSGFGTTTFEFQYGNNPESLTKEFFEDAVPWRTLKRDASFISKHKVTHVLLHKEYKFDEKNKSRLPNVELVLIDENQSFAIYRVKN